MTHHRLFFDLLHAGRWLKGRGWAKYERLTFYRYTLLNEAIKEVA